MTTSSSVGGAKLRPHLLRTGPPPSHRRPARVLSPGRREHQLRQGQLNRCSLRRWGRVIAHTGHDDPSRPVRGYVSCLT